MESLRPVFETASVLAFIGFALCFAIKEVPLKTRLAPPPLGDPLQMPRDATSIEELGRIVERLTAQENRWRVYQRSAERLGVGLQPDELWLLARLGERGGRMSASELQKRLACSDAQRLRFCSGLVKSGMAGEVPGGGFELTAKGAAVYAGLTRNREEDLRYMLSGWDRNQHPDVRALLREMANTFASTPPEKPGR